MQRLGDRGVPIIERSNETSNASRLVQDWDAVRFFLQVARQGSFRAAAESLGRSVNALRHQVDRLERQLGVLLLTRHVDGIRITAEGQRVFDAAQRMEAAAFSLSLAPATDRDEQPIEGEVRLAVTEGLGTFWIGPRVVEFQQAYPKVLVDLSCAMHSADVLRLEADVSIQLTRPTSPDLKITKIGRLHIVPFAAQKYLDRYGSPRTPSELLKHRIVLQVAEQVTSQSEYDRLFPGVPQPGFVAIRTNVSSAHYWAITKGAGIGMLPTYGVAIGANLIPLDVGIYLPVDIWLAYHPDATRIARVRRLLDWIISVFDGRKYPWFHDSFIHPNEFPKSYEGKAFVNLFAGFNGSEPGHD